jgi:hypothetical protein
MVRIDNRQARMGWAIAEQPVIEGNMRLQGRRQQGHARARLEALPEVLAIPDQVWQMYGRTTLRRHCDHLSPRAR